MAFSRSWSAKCPRCGTKLQDSDYTCGNCHSGHIKVTPYQRYHDFGSGKSAVLFGCDHCGMSYGEPQCDCGAIVTVKTLRMGWTPGAVIFWSGVALASIIGAVYYKFGPPSYDQQPVAQPQALQQPAVAHHKKRHVQ